MHHFNSPCLKIAFAALALAGSLPFATSVHAQVTILDQIGPNSATVGTKGFVSQFFEPANSQYDTASGDDFFAPATLLDLTEVQAAVQGFQGFASYANVTGWNVEIYSSESAATNLNGDIASVSLSPAQVTVDTTFGPASENGALVTLPVNIVLPSSGVYYVSVIADNPFETNGEVKIDTAAFGTTQANAFISNPGGGFYPNVQGVQDLEADLAYRIVATAVPEPSTYALLGLGGLVLLAAFRLRCRVA